MQIQMMSGSTGDVFVGTTPTVVPLTNRVIATGVTSLSGLIELDPDVSADVTATLAWRYFQNDDSQSAGTWQFSTASLSGAGKLFDQVTVSGSGLMIQAGLRLVHSGAGAGAENAIARLLYPVALTS